MKRSLTIIALLATGIAGGLTTLLTVATAAQSTLPVRAHVAELAGDSAGPPTPTPTPQPTAIPTVTPTNPPAPPSPEPAQGLVIRHYSSYVDSIGAIWIVGEVYNGLSADAEFVEITANYYSASGVLLDTETGFADLTVVPAGSDSPFEILVFEPPAGIARYSLQVTDYESPPFDGDARVTGLDAAVTNTFTDSIDFLHIVGTVTNNSGTSYDFVEPIFAFYDASGTVVRVEDTFTKPTTLGPGQQGSFEALLDLDGTSIVSRRVWVDADR